MNFQSAANVYVVTVQSKSNDEILGEFVSGDSIPLPDVGETVDLSRSPSVVETEDSDTESKDEDRIISEGRYIIENRVFNYESLSEDDIDGLSQDTFVTLTKLIVSSTD